MNTVCLSEHHLLLSDCLGGWKYCYPLSSFELVSKLKRITRTELLTPLVGRINRGIEDASKKGMETWYVERYIRPFVPARKLSTGVMGDSFHPRRTR